MKTGEKVGAVQPGEEQWIPHDNIPVSEGSLQGSWRVTLYQELQ